MNSDTKFRNRSYLHRALQLWGLSSLPLGARDAYRTRDSVFVAQCCQEKPKQETIRRAQRQNDGTIPYW